MVKQYWAKRGGRPSSAAPKGRSSTKRGGTATSEDAPASSKKKARKSTEERESKAPSVPPEEDEEEELSEEAKAELNKRAGEARLKWDKVANWDNDCTVEMLEKDPDEKLTAEIKL